jgi:PAS domain S-box-containing protein
VAGPPTLLQLRERVHPHDLAQFDAHLHDALDTHREIRGEFRILHPGGEIKHIDCIGHPMFSETGELVEYVGTIMDITERKRAEEQLWRSAAYLAEAERLGHTGCWVCDLATDVHYWSPEMYRILGIDPEGPVDFEKFRQRIHPEDEPLLARLADESIAARRAYEGECRLLLPDGTLKYVKFIARPLVSPSANLDGYVGAFMDVTEFKRVEQQLASSLAEVRSLSARSSR